MLRKKIIEQKEPPRTLKGIIDDARKYEQSYYQSLQWKDDITRWQPMHLLPHSLMWPAYTPKPQDPDAMDINRMSIEEWNDYLRKRLCFQCGQTGHMSHNHVTNPSLNTEKGKTSNFRKHATPYKAIMPPLNKGRNATQKVRAIMTELKNEDLEEAKTAFIYRMPG